MTSPSVGWSLGVSIMWIWHIPMLCNAATGMTSVWGFQTATLLGAGVAFWWPIYGPSKERHLAPLSGVVYLFAACIGCSLLGIYIAFTPTSVCPIFLSAADPMGIRLFLQNSWGMNYARDQQLGGLIMWVPSCMLYVGTVMALMGRWYAGETGQEQKVQVK